METQCVKMYKTVLNYLTVLDVSYFGGVENCYYNIRVHSEKLLVLR